jgi:hypothetical protein
VLEKPRTVHLRISVGVVASNLVVSAVGPAERVDVARPASGLTIKLCEPVIAVDVKDILEASVAEAPEHLVDHRAAIAHRRTADAPVPNPILRKQLGNRRELLGIATKSVLRTQLMDGKPVFGGEYRSASDPTMPQFCERAGGPLGVSMRETGATG